MNERNLDDVKSVPIIDVAQQIMPGAAFDLHGNYYFYVCLHPAHSGSTRNNEKKQHARLNQRMNSFYCNGCQAHGSNLDFVMHYTGCMLPEAIKIVAKIGGIELTDTAPKPRLLDPRREMMKIARRLWDEHPDKSVFHDYWLRQRFLTNEAAMQFKPGLAPGGDILTKELYRLGFKKQHLIDMGVTFQNGMDYFQNRILIETNGNVIGRAINADAEKKVLVMKGSYNGFFNAQYALQHSVVIIVEGIFDAISVWILIRMLGLKMGVIAIHGTTAYQGEWFVELAARGLKQAFIMLDMDPWTNEEGKPHAVGQRAAIRLAKQLTEADIIPWICKLPDNEDPNDMLKKITKGIYAAGDFRHIIIEAETPWEFALDVQSRYYDATRLAGQIRLLEAAKEYMKDFGVPRLGAWDTLAKLTKCQVGELAEYLQDTVDELCFETDKGKLLTILRRLKEKGLKEEELLTIYNLL